MRRRRSSAKAGKGSGALIVLAAIIGGPLWLIGALSGPPKPAEIAPPVSYVSLPSPTSTPSSPPALLADSPPAARSEPAWPADRARPAAERRPTDETLYVSGHKVPLRADPDAKGRILDRYGPGQAVDVLERGDGWIRVRHKLTQREGWIQARRLREEPPAAEAKEPEPTRAKVSPALSIVEIAKLLIAESIAQYPGPCACPYQSARNGSSCGKRAAYVRPGGYAPLCFTHDVTPAMIAEYRASH